MSTYGYAWAAGFVDGEGTISLRENRNGSISILLEASQTSLRPLARLSGLFGGHVQGPYKPRGHGKLPLYRWRISGSTAQQAIALMEPFLTVKQERARIIARFPVTDNRRPTPEMKALRESLREEMYYGELSNPAGDRSVGERCDPVVGTHSSPHKGCILR